jgi:hypothetical protein
VGGTANVFAQDEGYVDLWVIEGVVTKAGSNNTNIAVMDENLATNLFAPNYARVTSISSLSNGEIALDVAPESVINLSSSLHGQIRYLLTIPSLL